MQQATTRQPLTDSGGFTRARAWLHQHKLDRRLARGEDPNRDPLCTQRAVTLVDHSLRHRLATSLEDLAPWGPAVDTLVERLRAPAPVKPQGVAQASLLVTEAASPLWGGRGEPALREAAGRALLALDQGPALRPSHS